MLRSLLIFSILVPGFVAALRSRHAALLMYLWFALFRPQDWLWIDITDLRVSLVLGLVLLLPALVTGLLPNFTHPLSIGMWLFLVSSLTSQLGAIRPDIGWPWVDFLFRLFLASTLLVTLTSDSKRLIGVIAVIGGSMGFHAAKAGVAFLVMGGMRFGDGLAGAFVDNNGYALGTTMIMPLLLVTAQNIERLVPQPGFIQTWMRRGFYAAVPLCLFAVIGTYSRGGFLSVIAAVVVFLLLQRRRFTALASVIVVGTILLAVVPIPKSYIQRLETIKTYEEVGEDSALSRPHFWKVGIQMGLTNLFGVGLRQFEVAYDRYDSLYGRFGRSRAVHSAHVQVFAELGVFGATIWAAMFAYAFIACLRIRSRSRQEHLTPGDRKLLFTVANALLVSMSAFIVGGAFLALALNDLTWLTFGMVAAADRLSIKLCEEPTATPVSAAAPNLPPAFRGIPAYPANRGFSAARGGRL